MDLSYGKTPVLYEELYRGIEGNFRGSDDVRFLLTIFLLNMDINLNHRIIPQVTGKNHLPVTIHFGFLFVIIFCISLFAGGQTLPDSIVITKNIYINNKGIDSFQRSDRYSLLYTGENYFLKDKKISKSKVLGFVSEIQKRSNVEHSFKYFCIDTN